MLLRRTSLFLALALTACGADTRIRSDAGPRPDAGPPLDAGAVGLCGDGVRGVGELCDGADLGGATCETLRFEGGALACAATCDAYDFSACVGEAGVCGNGVLEPGERCDGADVGDATCASEGFGATGELACAAGCLAFDGAGCESETVPGAPEIVSLSLDVATLTEGQSATITVTATDSDGDLVGATLTDAEIDYGALVATTPGTWTRTVTWGQLHAARPIEFDDTASRDFTVTVTDAEGNATARTTSIALTCGGEPACDGACGATTISDCGACGNVCGPGAACVDGECEATTGAPAVGEVFFTEVMIDPNDHSDSEGEWVELYNGTSRPLSLAGCRLADEAVEVEIPGAVEIAPGAYVALSSGAAPGFTPVAVYGRLGLNNTGDSLSLICGTTTVDTITYDVTFVTPGESNELSRSRLSASQNDSASSWCRGAAIYATTDRGTPGRVNDCAR